jgi:hypothetical protein
MKLIFKILILSTFAIISQSCTSQRSAELSISSKWMTPAPHIRPVSGKDKIVYCSIKNTSGSSLELKEAVLTKIKSLGYRVTDDLDEARFVLMADLRYFGKKTKKGYGGTVGGALIGAAAGGVIGNTTSKGNNRTRDTVIGSVVGAVIGGFIGNYKDNKDKIDIFDLVVDIRIGEKIMGGIETKVAKNSARAINSANRSGSESAKSNSSSKETSSFVRQENFDYHQSRLVCTAKKWGLTEAEAQTPLSKKLSDQISRLLP